MTLPFYVGLGLLAPARARAQGFGPGAGRGGWLGVSAGAGPQNVRMINDFCGNGSPMAVANGVVGR